MKDHQNRQPSMSVRDIEKMYGNLLIQPADPGRVNCYTCSKCGYVTKTIDIHVGVTPMFNSCVKCGSQSVSSWYNDIAPDQQPTHEWVIPSLKEMMKYRSNPAMIDHFKNGGLDFRKIKEEN